MCKPCWRKSPAGRAQAAEYHRRTRDDKKKYYHNYYLRHAQDKWGVKTPGVGTGYRPLTKLEIVARRAMRSAKYRAQRDRVPFTLTYETLPQLSERCPACEKLYDFMRSIKTTMDRPSLDRVTPSLGYVPGNVVFVCMECNLRMQNSTSDDLFRLARFRQACGGLTPCRASR